MGATMGDQCDNAEEGVRDADAARSWLWARTLVDSLPDALEGIGDAILRSRAMLDLRDDWDEDGAKRIAEGTWRRAAAFLARRARWVWDRHRRVTDAPDITPCPDGGVDLHWDRPGYEMLVGVPADPRAKAGFYGAARGGAAIKGTIDLRSESISD